MTAYLRRMWHLELSFWRSLDSHHRLVLEPGHTPKILVRDVGIGLVLVEELQLQLSVADEVIQLILFGFEISLK